MSVDTLSLQEQLLDRVAKLVAMNVSQKQIAQACGLSEARISQVVDTDKFRQRLAELQSEDLEQSDTLNRGWDALEEFAMGHVLEAMQANPDPEFALRVANSANKAQRRGGLGNAPINGKTNATAVINLNMAFVTKLQETVQLGQRAIDMNAKRVDALPLQDAETLLHTDTFQTEINEIFNVDIE